MTRSGEREEDRCGQHVDGEVRVVCRNRALAGRCRLLPQAGGSRRTAKVLVGALLLMIALPAVSLAQTPGQAFSRRPWVGFWVGGNFGFDADTPRGGADTELSLDFPVVQAGGLRFDVGRAWANAEGAEDLSIRRVTATILVRRPLGSVGGCANAVHTGFGAGLYSYDFAERPDSQRRGGYHLVVGSMCDSSRLSLGVQMHGRFMGNPAPESNNGFLFALDFQVGVRLRL